ncbi:MAG: PHP domain-containing protein, partial [Gammaproteobacteria bacterium]|nr:PHP domain-containing protein [Gammaproteobacteria bacterium]
MPKLIESVQQAGMNSIALTDDMSLFSAVKFYQKAIDSGVKPIIGAKVSVDYGSSQYDVIMLCQNNEGYLNLSELISKAYLSEYGIEGVSVTEEQLVEHQSGLIMVATSVNSDIAQLLLDKESNLAEEKALSWKSIFSDRYYMSVQRIDKPSDEQLLHQTIGLGLLVDIP